MLIRRLTYPGTTGLLLRRTFKQLNGNHIIPLLMQFPRLKDWYNKSEQALFIPTEPESVLFFGHCEHETDVFQYQGQAFDDIAVEEVTQFTEFQWQMLTTSLRPSGLAVAGSEISPPVMWATGNPGGIGHTWAKNLWIDRTSIQKGDEKKYLYIPARVYDNQALMTADPEYERSLRAISDPNLRKAYLDGNWDVYPGQFFYMWRRDQILCKSFWIPPSWKVFGAIDYGESAPTSYGHYAVSHTGVIYRLWGYYQANRSASEHASEIRSRINACPFTGGRRPSAIFADPSMWIKHRLDTARGKSRADVFAEHGVFLTRANNDRVAGWSRVKDVLTHEAFHAFDGQNEAFMRTVPGVPRDEHNWEDVDTDSEDHCADEFRYAVMHIWKPRGLSVPEDDGTGEALLKELLSKQTDQSSRYSYTTETVENLLGLN